MAYQRECRKRSGRKMLELVKNMLCQEIESKKDWNIEICVDFECHQFQSSSEEDDELMNDVKLWSVPRI